MPSFSSLPFARLLLPAPGVQRVYVLAAFLNAIGTGMFLPIYVLYFTRVVGLPEVQVGLALTISALVAIPVAIPAGDLADRFGILQVARWSRLGQSVMMVVNLFVGDFWTLLAVNTLLTLFTTAYLSSGGALVRRVGGDDTVTFRSKIRTLGNIGVSLGALGAGIGIQIGTPTAYRALVLCNAVSFFVSWVVLAWLPDYRPLPRPEEGADTGVPRWISLRDKAFVAYSLVGGVMAVQNFILELMIPVWIVAHTRAPGWSVTVAFVINTGLVVLLQIRLGDKVQSIRDGGVALRRAGVVLLLGCAAMSFMGGLPAWGALLLLLVGIVLLTLGEIWYIAGTFALEYGLPPAYAQGQYQGLAGTVTSLSTAAAPTLLLGLALSLGNVGWIGLGGCLLLLGLASPAIAAWGERTRPVAEPTR